MVIEDVHIIQSHAFEALIAAGDEIFPGTPFSVGSVPHEESGFAGDDEFIAVRRQIRCHDATEIFFSGTGNRTVVVGEVEVGDSEVERGFHHGGAVFQHVDRAEVLPQTERDRRKQDAASAAAPVCHFRIAFFRCKIHNAPPDKFLLYCSIKCGKCQCGAEAFRFSKQFPNE